MNVKNKTLQVTTLLGSAASAALIGAWMATAAPDPSNQPWGYLAPIELSNRNLEDGIAQGFRTWFENGQFQGDLVEYTVAPNGTLSTTIDLSGASPANTDPFTNWSAAVRFAAREAADANWWDATTNPSDSRKIITRVNFAQTAFQWGSMTTPLQNAIDPGSAGNASSDIFNHVRGDRSQEVDNGGSLRNRLGVLGSIIHANPVYVGAPDADYSSASYFSFAAARANRAPRVYVGANDGMLHAFDAETGDEVWAYIPSVLLEDLDELTSTSYSHRYFVDGGLTAADVEVNTGTWRTLLGGGLGAGGKGIFVLDITDEDLTSESSTGALYAGDDRKLVGELVPAFDDDLGHVYGRPIFAQLNNGDWYMVHGNGYNSVNGVAKLYLINLRTGGVTRLTTDSTTDNGLSGPALVDTNSDGKIDVAYAGDLKGRMWKFDLPVNDSGNLDPANGSLLIDTGLSITSTPDVARHSLYGYMVYFATGRLLTDTDANDGTTVNAAYGIWDKPGTAGTGGLYTVSLSGDLAYDDETLRTLITPNTPIDWEGDDANTGWKLPFNAGDRVITEVQVRAGRVKMVTMNPTTYENWVIEPNIEDGGPYLYPIFDINADGSLNVNDRIDQNNNGVVTDPSDVPMAWKMPTGLVSRLTIARLGRARDTAFYNNLLLPEYPDPCIGACEGGIFGGHFDLDTDARDSHADGNGFANDTSKHDHEYDDKYNTTEADYFSAPDHPQLQDAFSASEQNKEFMVLIANADLSPGGFLTIGTKTWNVLDYQIMLHKKLRDWDGTGDLLDDDGDSLFFTINGILGKDTSGVPVDGATAGTVKTAFYADAIASGGLIPTRTGCVKEVNDVFDVDDRWRNGALHMQVVTRDELVAGIPSGGVGLDALYVQEPPDLVNPVVYDGFSTTMNDAHADYPIFGGLRVPGDPEANDDPDMFRYESTLFWHYDGDFCYGEDEWELEVAKYRGLSEEEFEDLTGYSLDEYLALDKDDFDDCKKIDSGTFKDGIAGCKDEYENWKAAGDLIEYVNQGSGAELTLGDGFDAHTGAGLTTGTLTPPPKGYASDYEYGRQGWSDVVRD